MIKFCTVCARKTRHKVNLEEKLTECQECEGGFIKRFRNHEGDDFKPLPPTPQIFTPRWQDK